MDETTAPVDGNAFTYEEEPTITLDALREAFITLERINDLEVGCPVLKANILSVESDIMAIVRGEIWLEGDEVLFIGDCPEEW